MLTDRLSADAKRLFDRFFSECVEFDYSINENTRSLIKLSNAAFASENSSDEKDWLKKFENGGDLELFQEYIMLSAKIQDDNKKKGKDGGQIAVTPLLQIKTFAELKENFEKLGGEVDKFVKNSNVQPEFGNSCVARRVKIFRSAQHYGAEFYQNRDWTMTWTHTRQQQYVFGRPKPPCLSSDPTKVFEPANYDDWEEGFDPRWKNLRDNPGKNWVRDNPIATFNSDSGYAYAESEYWCTANARRTGWYPGNDQSKNELIQFMDHRDGLMYQFNNSYILSEGDTSYGVLKGLSGSSNKVLDTVRRQNPTLNQLFEQAKFDVRWNKDCASNNVKDTGYLIKQLRASGKITRNGWMIVESQEDVHDAVTVLDKIFGIVIGKNVGCRLKFSFKSDVPLNVNCENAADFAPKFQECKAPYINLYGCENLKDMSEMFSGVVTESIRGLDTSGAKNTTNMLNYARHPMGKILSIPGEIDLRNCTEAYGMFQNSDIGGVKFVNVSGVRHASRMFVGCSMMREIPDIRGFTGISQPDLNLAEKGDYAKIFDGCDELFSAKIKIDGKEISFDEYMDVVTDTFKNLQRENIRKMVDPEDGFLIVDSRETVDAYCDIFKNYPGVRLSEKLKSADYLLQSHEIRIKTLDVNGHTSVVGLFKDCIIYRLDRIIGTEKVVNCANMFESVDATAYPDMAFPAAVNIDGFFCGAEAPRKLPRVSFGPKTDLSEYDTEYAKAISRISLEGIVPPKPGERGQMIDMQGHA